MRLPRVADTAIQDIRFGFRQARRSPGLAVVIILSLALGVGANTALFSVVNAVMLRGAAVAEPATLVAFGTVRSAPVPDEIMENQSGRSRIFPNGQSAGLSFPYPSFTYIRSHARAFSDVVGFVPLGMFEKASAVVRGEPMFVDGDMVTDRYFEMLGVTAARGRVLAKEDQEPAAARVGVISDRFWRRAFARDPSAVGASITVNGVPVTIVGVARQGFTGLEAGRWPDIWLPITLQAGLTPWGGRWEGSPEVEFRKPTRWWLQVVARTKPGVTREQAQAEASRLLRDSYGGTVPDGILGQVPKVVLAPGATGFNIAESRLSKPLSVLSVVVALVLLVACANVATLLLTRATSRRKEMSVRLAVGASRGRLFRQLLTEHALYGLTGSAVGLLFAAATAPLLLRLLWTAREPLALEATLDVRVLGFTAAVSIVTTILFGIVPAMRAARANVAGNLRDSAGGVAADARLGRLRLGRLFVAVQVAMTVPLVIGAGLFLRTLANLQNEQLGFNSEHVLLFSLDVTKAGYKDASVGRAYEQIRTAIEAIPGVTGASFSRLGLVTGWSNNGSITVEGATQPERPPRTMVFSNEIGPQFPETMGMRLLLGRTLTEADLTGSLKVAVINEAMARKFFAGSSPIGRRFYRGRARAGADAITIIGVLKDAKFASVRAPAPPTYFVPYTQTRYPVMSMNFEVRTAGDPLSLVERVRRIAARVAPGVPLGDVKTQAAQVEESLGQERMFARLFTFFGLTALALACLGLHGTMAYMLKRRTREIGIRIALGATRGAVIRMALVDTLLIAGAGIAAGAALSAGGVRFVRSLLFGVTPLNPATIAGGIGLMLTVAIVAGYLPARRACKVDPMRALRDE